MKLSSHEECVDSSESMLYFYLSLMVHLSCVILTSKIVLDSHNPLANWLRSDDEPCGNIIIASDSPA